MSSGTPRLEIVFLVPPCFTESSIESPICPQLLRESLSGSHRVFSYCGRPWTLQSQIALKLCRCLAKRGISGLGTCRRMHCTSRSYPTSGDKLFTTHLLAWEPCRHGAYSSETRTIENFDNRARKHYCIFTVLDLRRPADFLSLVTDPNPSQPTGSEEAQPATYHLPQSSSEILPDATSKLWSILPILNKSTSLQKYNMLHAERPRIEGENAG